MRTQLLRWLYKHWPQRLRRGNWDYRVSAAQLFYLCKILEETRELEGSIVEVGVAYGRTSLFISKFLKSAKIENRNYYAMDTFSGFTEEDISYERTVRGKTGKIVQDLQNAFPINSRERFDDLMKRNGADNVVSIMADAATYDFAEIGPVVMAFLDVDLYRVTKTALQNVWANVVNGGYVLVHDCDPTHALYDGADQAYREFCESVKQPESIVYGSLGVLKKH